MKYKLNKDNNDLKLMYYNVNIEGLSIVPKNEVPDLDIKAGKVVLVDKDLTDSYIKQRINRKIDKIIKFMLRILNDEGTTEDDTGLVLDEVNRLKGIVINKYKAHMVESEYKALLTKIILIEEEFKKNYNEKIYRSMIANNYYEEVIRSERGR